MKKKKEKRKRENHSLQLWLQQAEQGFCLSAAGFDIEYHGDKTLFVRDSLK